MSFDYETFRAMPWGERVTAFNALPDADKAALVRTHITRWLDAHRAELTPEQIEVIQAHIDFVTPDLYVPKKRKQFLVAAKKLEWRANEVLSRDQQREALTLHW